MKWSGATLMEEEGFRMSAGLAAGACRPVLGRALDSDLVGGGSGPDEIAQWCPCYGNGVFIGPMEGEVVRHKE